MPEKKENMISDNYYSTVTLEEVENKIYSYMKESNLVQGVEDPDNIIIDEELFFDTEEQQTGYIWNSNPEIMEEKTKYRTIISKDKLKVRYFRVPEDFEGNLREITDQIIARNKKFQELTELPSREKELLREKIINFQPKQKEIKYIELEEFDEKIQRYCINKSNSFPYIIKNSDTFINSISTDKGTCDKNVIVNVRLGATKYIKGFTTGKVYKNEVEIIGYKAVQQLAKGNLRPLNAKLRKYKFHYGNIRTSAIFDLYKVEVKSIQDTINLPSKIIRKSMIGNTYSPKYIRIGKAPIIDEKGYKHPVIEILAPNGKFITFLQSECEFFYPDHAVFQLSTKDYTSKLITENGQKAKVVDDRKTLLKRGDIVKVTNVHISTDGKDTLRVVDKTGKIHNILSKQVKRVLE